MMIGMSITVLVTMKTIWFSSLRVPVAASAMATQTNDDKQQQAALNPTLAMIVGAVPTASVAVLRLSSVTYNDGMRCVRNPPLYLGSAPTHGISNGIF